MPWGDTTSHSIALAAAPLIHPHLALMGLAAGLIPLLIHFWSRSRYRRVPWAAMHFLLAAQRKTTRRVRFEQWMMLLLRIVLVALIGFAAARPFVPSGWSAGVGTLRTHRIVIFDNSLSMNGHAEAATLRAEHDRDAPTLIERARARVLAMLESFPHQDAVSLVTTASPAETVIDVGCMDRRLIQERLQSLKASQRVADVAGALEHAIRIAQSSESAPSQRIVYFLSNFPERTWDEAAGPAVSPAVAAARRLAEALENPAEQFVAVLFRSGSDNLAITSLSKAPGLAVVGHALTVLTCITNFGTKPAENTGVAWRQDGTVVERASIPVLEPGQSITVSAVLSFATPGTSVVEARVLRPEDDALPLDDVRFLVVEASRGLEVLVVDGKPGVTPLSSGSGFLVAALSPGRFRFDASAPAAAGVYASGAGMIRTKVITESELLAEPLSEYSVVILCNAARLGEPVWRSLERFVRHGGGLMIFAGDRLDVDDYNTFGFAGGNGLLPGTLNPPRDAPVGVNRQDQQDKKAEGKEGLPGMGISPEIGAHPIVDDFRNFPTSGLFTAKVARYVPITVNPAAGEVVLRYENRTPMLVTGAFGKGRLVLCTTTANLDWTNLPARGDFVSLVLNALIHVTSDAGAHRNLLVGDSLGEPLSARESLMQIRAIPPGGAPAAASLVPREGGLEARYGPLEEAGAVALSVGGSMRWFSVNVDCAASELASATPAQLAAALEGKIRVVDADAPERAIEVRHVSVELSRSIWYLVAALAIVEMWLAWFWGTGRKSVSG